jgi:hypothetical protein
MQNEPAHQQQHTAPIVPVGYLRNRIAAEQAANVIALRREPDASYKGNVKRFKEFIDKRRETGEVPQGEKYITRENVDFYFAVHVARKGNVQSNTVQRIVSSLQNHASNYEYLDGTFSVMSPSVQASLQAQKQARIEYLLAQEDTEDPHSNLPTNIITHDQQVRVIELCFQQNYANFGEFMFSFNAGMQCYLRNDSCRKLFLPDLKLDFAHGPVESGPQARIITFILRPLKHKDRDKDKRVVGAFQHREYLLCTTLAIAINVYMKLSMNHDVHFYKEGRDKWTKVKLISGWKDHVAAQAAYKTILSRANVNWEKVTHMRKAGIERGSARGGLRRDEVQSMSKHRGEKLDDVYMTELYSKVLLVMSGFTKRDDYFVPRLELDIDWTEEELASFLFPQLNIWRAQQQSERGDKTAAAADFLFNIIPFFSGVLARSGAFFIQAFPQHSLSMRLRSALPPSYERWARDARAKVQELLTNKNASRVAELNAAVQASYNELQRQSAGQTAALNDCIRNLQQDVTRLEHGQANLREGQAQVLQSVLEIKQLVLAQAASNTGASNTGASNTEGRRLAQFANTRTLIPGNEGNRVIATTTGTVTAARAQVNPPDRQRNVNDALQNTLQGPIIPRTLPNTVESFLQEHGIYKLEQYRYCDKGHWEPHARNSFSRRMYLHDRIIQRAQHLRGEFEQRKTTAARQMDDELRDKALSMDKYIKFLKSNDSTIKKRKRNKN